MVLFGFVIVLLGKSRISHNDQDETQALETKIKQLEQDLKRNNAVVKKLGKSVADLFKETYFTASKEILWGNVSGKIEAKDCLFAERPLKKPDVQMLDVYQKLEFDNPDGGVWKQGWDVEYDSARYTSQNKLQVFVVPHSHNDPGWIKTFEQYYEAQTRQILNNMVTKVAESPNWKFIWAEISYLNLWWKESDPEMRNKLRELVKSGQIEVVTGGWVMNDEANCHYFAMIEQLTSGHEWMRQKIGVSPKNGWAIDPFGMSSSMAYLLKRSGLENMVIQRVHYAIKKFMASKQNLEFRWRQNWDREGLTDMMCHMMPFYSYDVPHTCGPNPKICCQFDFRRLGSRDQSPIYCPWRIAPVPIDEWNVEQKAWMLLEQYRKKSMLYKTNVLLVQLGDDFRYDTATEFDQQFTNYQKLFDYMNDRSDWFVEAKFGTLQDYFQALRSSVEQSIDHFPSLSGDFFTYADIDDHYWSGYYTTRPYHKHMDRVLEHYLRSADIIFSLALSHGKSLQSVADPAWSNQMASMLTAARRSLALFQHHDGITGTAKNHVVVDYANKLFAGIQNCRRVIDQCAHYLLRSDQDDFAPQIEEQRFLVDDIQLFYNQLPKKAVIRMDRVDAGMSRRIVFYNSLVSERVETVTLRVSHPNIQVSDDSGGVVRAQLLPVFSSPWKISDSEFEVAFSVSVPPLGMATYFLRQLGGPISANTNLEVSRIMVKESAVPVSTAKPFLVQVQGSSTSTFSLKNGHLSAEFNADGLLSSVTDLSSGSRIALGVEFVAYGTRKGSTRSGAYLFLPDGDAEVIRPDENHHLVVVNGSLRSTVDVHLPFVVHQVVLHSSAGVDGVGMDVNNLVKVTGRKNMELAMRITSGLASERVFYTDLNGLQMTRRERWNKLPLQAHFYPMPTAAYIEDSSARITVATKQSLGVASLKSGQLEVMQDRRLSQDDNRGLGQGVTDNVLPTMCSFRLLVEPRNKLCNENNYRPDGYLSLSGHHALHSLLYPIHQLVWSDTSPQDVALNTSFRPAVNGNGADVHLVNLRTEATLLDAADDAAEAGARTALIVHRLGFDCCLPAAGFNQTTSGGQFSVARLFPDYFDQRVEPTSLTLMHDAPAIDKTSLVALEPMEIYTFHLRP